MSVNSLINEYNDKNMKYIPYMTILAGLLMAACAKENIVEEGQKVSDNAVTFSGLMDSRQGSESAPGTRTSYNDNGNVINVEWAEGDGIGIFCKVGDAVTAANFHYSNTTAGKMASFSAVDEAISWEDMESLHDFYAYYPYAATAVDAQADLHAVPVSLPAVQVYDEADPMGHLADNGFIYAKTEGQSREIVGNGSVPLKFSHLFPVLEVRITADRFAFLDRIVFRSKTGTSKVSFEGGKVDIETGNLDLSGAEGGPSTSLEGSMPLLMSVPVSFCLLMPPGHGGEDFVIEAVINGKTVTLAERTAPEEGFAAGKAYYVYAPMSIDESDTAPVVDLSAEEKANTYYVTKANTLYSFDATVKGNGEQQYALEETTIEPKSLLVLWYTCLQTSSEPWARNEPILVETLTLGPDGRAYFKTPVAFVPGNVVIVALDQELDYDTVVADETTHVISNANVLWSWNLVVAEGYDPMAAENQYQKGGYIFMSRDLGAFFDSEDALIDGATNMFALAGTAGNCYQWGRKDPFPAFPCYDSGKDGGLAFTPAYTLIPALDRGTIPADGSGRPAYNQIFGNTSGTIPLDVSGNTYSTTAEFVQEQTQNPHLWLRTWSIPGDDKSNLWGNPDGDNIGVKTIHDPCPPGYRVMTRAAWNALTENQAPSLAVVVDHRRGILLDDSCYFPVYGNIPLRTIEGISQGDRGCFNYTGNGGRTGLWTAEMTAVSFYGGGKNPGDAAEYTTADNPNLMQGCSVRCIRTLYTGVLPGTDGDGNLVDLGREDW